MKDGVVSDGYIITNEYMRINFYIVPNRYVAAYIGKCTPINIFPHRYILVDETGFFNARLLKINGLVVFFQKQREAGVGIVHQNKGGDNFFFCLKIPSYDD